MADDTQNPNQPQTPQPGTPAAGPARSGPGVDPNTANAFAALDAFNRAIPAIKEIASQVDKLVEKMDKVGKGADTMRKNTREFGNELKQSMAYADSLEDSIKAMFDYQKRMVREGLKASNYEDVVKVFEEMETQNKRLVDNGVFSKKNAKLMQKNAEDIRRSIGTLKQEMGKTFDGEKVDHLVTEFMQMNKLTLDMARNLKGVRMPGLRGDIDGATKSLRHLFSMNDRGQKYRDFAKVASGLREARQSQVSGRKTAFNNQRASIEKDALRLGFKPRMRSDGSYDPDRAQAASLYARESARNRGMGWAGRSIVGRAAQERAMGQGHSVLTKAGMGLLARGEGSLGRGVASFGAGALEGAAGGIAELAGPMAPVLAGLEVIKMAFDKNQRMNSEVAGGLGKGGIFAGGGNPIDAIRNVRNNLNGPLYSPLGIGYDKNLAIAKSLQEGGIGTSNLANANLGKDQQGFSNGSFGALQRNVYGYGRLAGLDSTQTVAETIKLVTQYKQSLSSTHGFFVQINKDAATAGITTTKYIQIIDDVNSHYERSNKLLEATVDTMRLLSVTGRNTAEDLKDAMDTVTNGGQKHSLETSTFLNQNVLGDKDLSNRLSGSLKLTMQDSLDNVAKAMGSGFNRQGLESQIKSGGPGAFNQLLQQARDQFGDDKFGFAQASGAIEKARTAYNNSSDYQYARRDGVNRGGLDLAASRALTGDDINSQSIQTLAALKFSLKQGGFKTSDFMDPNRASALRSSLPYQQSLKALEVDPTKMNRVQSLLYDSASARMDIAGQGLSAEDRRNPNSQRKQFLDETYDYLAKNGVKFNKGQDRYSALQDLGKTKEGRSQMIGLFSKWDKTMDDIFNNPVLHEALRPKIDAQEKDQRMADAAKLASGTRDTADIFADAFSSFFNRLQTPLDFIAGILAKIGNHFHVTPDTADSAGMLSGLDARIGNKKVDAALGAYDNKIADLQDQIKNPKAGADVDDLKRQLGDTKQKRNQLNDVVQAAGDKTRRGLLSKDAVDAAINDTDYTDWNYKKVLSDSDTSSLFGNLGIDKIKPGQTMDLDQGKFHKFEGLADRLDPAKYTLKDTTDDKGVEHTTITYNNYQSVGITQNQDAANAVNKAPGETATPSKVTK